MRGQLRIRTRKHRVIESFHALSPKGRIQSTHFVNDAAETPHVAFVVIGLFLPNFGTGVVRGACLRVKHPILSYFTHVQVSHLVGAIRVLEYIGWLEVSMKDVPVMQFLQPCSHLDKCVPNVSLSELGGLFLVVHDLPVQVTTVCELHDDAKCWWAFIKEGLFVGNHIFVANMVIRV